MTAVIVHNGVLGPSHGIVAAGDPWFDVTERGVPWNPMNRLWIRHCKLNFAFYYNTSIFLHSATTHIKLVFIYL